MGMRKITVMIPEELIRAAIKDSGKNITDTIKEGLMMVKAKSAYRGLLSRRGKEKISLNIKELRKDKRS